MQSAPFGGDRQVAIAEATDEIERLLRLLLVRETERVLGHALFDDRAHLRGGTEEAIRGHEPTERLMRPLEVVALDEERDALVAVGEVGKHRPRQKLVPERLPESLDFAHRLRMLRPALHVPNAVEPQLLLEVRFAAPRRVLPALVGQHLLRLAVRRDAALEGLHHELRLLMVREVMRHDEARVVVHESRQVQPLVTAQQEREDVRLPELVRLRALEATRRMLARSSHFARLDESRLVQDPPHLGLRHAERFEARERVSDAPRPVLGMRFAVLDDRRPLRLSRRGRPSSRCSLGRFQRLLAPRAERPDPLVHRRGVQPECAAHRRVRRPLFHDEAADLTFQLHVVRPARPAGSSPTRRLRAL